MKLLSKACAYAAACRAVYEDGEDLVIVGNSPTPDQWRFLADKDAIGEGECTLRIAKSVVKDALKSHS